MYCALEDGALCAIKRCVRYSHGGELLWQPLFWFVQHQLNLVGDHCCLRQWKQGWYPALQSKGPLSTSPGIPLGGRPEGGGSSEGHPLPTVLQQNIFLAPVHPLTH